MTKIGDKRLAVFSRGASEVAVVTLDRDNSSTY